MLTENYITAFCTISKGVVSKNGTKIFKNTNDGPASFFTSIYQHFQLKYPKYYKMDNLSKLGWLATEILQYESFEKNNYQPEDIGIVLANANSSLDDDIKYFETTKAIASPSLFVYTLPNIVIGEICIRNNFKGEQAFFIQDKFDADFMCQQVNYLLNENILQACICGWVEVLEQDYKAVLFLAEKIKTKKSVLFSAENMDKFFNDIDN
ncbi:MAG TPA: hypothetical protein DCO83_07660 [Mucilaginibacter sp.]|nr:hypothetical protein [Mucilaginibacter sp.]